LQGARLVLGEKWKERRGERLRVLRRELGKPIGPGPRPISARFDQYVEAVLAHTGYWLESARAELEYGLERLIEPLLDGGFLDSRGYQDLIGSMEQQRREARTLDGLVSAYRRIVSDLETSIASPTAAHQDRSLRAALRFIHEHLAEPLSLEQAARAAGFAPDYLWRLFKRREGITFAQYVQNLRIGRAKHLLETTALSIDRVQKFSGFQSRASFHRVFKRSIGMTPTAYRSAE
jgi:YesN/AraC family two-component response regulator